MFKYELKKKLLEYFLYSKYKIKFNFILYIKKYFYLKEHYLRKENKNMISNNKKKE